VITTTGRPFISDHVGATWADMVHIAGWEQHLNGYTRPVPAPPRAARVQAAAPDAVVDDRHDLLETLRWDQWGDR